jgi:uncharacterized integral membrane protein
MQRKLIISLVIIIAIVVFSVQNAAPIAIRLFFWPVQSSPAFLISASLLIGAVPVILFSMKTNKSKSEKYPVGNENSTTGTRN